jgi:hypothetical protein
LSNVQFGRDGLVVDGRPVPLIAGEFNFWRHNPEDWRPILRHMRDMGLTIVTTFVCWDFHERGRGTYVLGAGDNPMRDLEGFLDAIAAEGLYCILRPGPIIDSEWPTRGPAPDVATLERTHPRFRERAEEWIAAVGPVIASRQAPAGGPVLMLQLDNEVFYPHCTEASATEADSAFHIPYDEELVLADLRAWQAGPGAGLATVPEATVALDRMEPAQRASAYRFLTDQVAGYLSWVEERFRATGVDLPCYSNVKQSCAYWDERSLADALSGGAGGNNYMDRLRDEEEFLVAVWWNGLQRTVSDFHWAPEYWCGRWIEMEQDTSVFEPDHYRFCAMTHTALGMRGLNYFMLVERDDWHYSPVTGIGRVREPLAEPVRDVNALLSRLGPDERVADVALAWSLGRHQETLARRGFDWTELSAIWWEMDQPKEDDVWWETLRALTLADLDFAIVDVNDDALAGYPVVVDPYGDATVGGDARHLAECAPEEVVAAATEAGAARAISADARGLWTSLYEAADGRRFGFCVNRTDDSVEAVLEVRGGPLGEADWLVAPAEWSAGDSRVTVAPRSVAAFATG